MTCRLNKEYKRRVIYSMCSRILCTNAGYVNKKRQHVGSVYKMNVMSSIT